MKPTVATFKATARQQEADRMLGGPQRHSMLVGGARSGKTLTLVKACVLRALRAPESRHVIFRLRFNAVRQSVGMDTLPKVMRLRFPGVKYAYNKSDYFFSFPDKTRPRQSADEGFGVWLCGLDDKDRVEKVLGKEFSSEYFNECSQIPYHSVTTAHTRLAQKCVDRDGQALVNRAFYDLNPVGTGHWSYRMFVEHRDPGGLKALADPADYAYMYMNPGDNAENLDPKYIASLMAMPERMRRRYFDGRYVAQLDGALWTLEGIEALRLIPPDDKIPEMRRIVIGVDPSGASGQFDVKADEIGIVGAGLGTDDHVYVLEDETGLYSPEGWGRAAVLMYMRLKADSIVVEDNFGGDMVRAVIQGVMIDGQNVGRSVPVRKVTASRGKAVRAEPIAAMYERGLVHHVGQFPQLEDEMTNFTTAGYMGPGSPNRCDSLVWCTAELFGNNLTLGLLDYVASQEAHAIDRAADPAMAREEDEQKRAEQRAELKRLADEDRMKVSKLTQAGTLMKPVTTSADGKNPTPTCGKCGSTAPLTRIPGGRRCPNCGEQFQDNGVGVLPLMPSRGELLK